MVFCMFTRGYPLFSLNSLIPQTAFREDFDLFAGLQAQFLTSGRKKDGTVGTIFGSHLWVDRRKG